MANANQKVGASPSGNCLRVRQYVADAVIYPGDFVILASSGKVSRATTSTALVGVAVSYSSADGQNILVADHPDQEFSCQSDDATIDAQTDFNLNYDIVVGTPSTVYKRSGMQIDASTQNTTATLPIKVLRMEPSINNALGDAVKVIFVINNHSYNGSTGTAGI